MKHQEYVQKINELQKTLDELKTNEIVQALLTQDMVDNNVQNFLAQKWGLFAIPASQPGWGDPHKKYVFLHPDAPQQLYDLMQDELSKQIVENAVDRLLYLTPPEKYKEHFLYAPLFSRSKFEVSCAEEFARVLPALCQKYPGFNIAPETFFGEHSLTFLNDCVKDYIRGGVFFDCGAYDGASSIIMNQYSPQKIHLIEPSEKNLQITVTNLKKFAPTLNYTCHPVCVGAKKGTVFFDGNDGQSSRIATEMKENVQEVAVETLDHICSKNNVTDIRWIKADLEGEGKNMIIGAEKTIKRFKPLMTIGVYHNPQEFYEIAPLLKKMVPEYQFAMRRYYTYLNPGMLYSEETLVAYCPRPNDPKEWYDNGRFPYK